MEESEGRAQGERYEKVRVLGQGSMGKAYLVRCSEDNCLYVMKRINIGHLQQKQRQGALREAQLHSILQHPNIVQFKELYQTTSDKLCIIMEYAQGGDLEEFIRAQNNKPLGEAVILGMFVQICLGLQEVHARKIIHRDLKTANIFLTADRQIKIGDFGISRTMDRTQLAATSMIGTPYYLSPEMVEGKPYSTKADVWALGVVLYQLCSYKLPFQANSLPVLALKILKGSFPPLPNHYSKDLKALLLQLLTTDQKRRPSIDVILAKPFLSKYLPQEEKVKLVARQQQRQQAKQKKEKEKESEKADKSEKGDEGKEKAREKREQLRKQMREDLKKKRAQKDYQSVQLPIPDQPRQIKKSPRKDTSITPKPEAKIKKQEVTKPWKTKKISDKKDITIEIFAPEHKPQFVEPLKIETKPQSNKSIEEGRKSMPLITEKAPNYHYNKQKQQEEQEEYPEEQIEQESSEDDEEFNEILNQVRNVQELANKLKPTKQVCLFEDSGNFDSTVTPPKPPPQQELDSLKQVLSAESLEQLRFILQENLGDNRFRQAYSVMRQHIEGYYEMLGQEGADRQALKRDYIFNQQILNDKLNFLTKEQRERNLELLFTLIIYEEIETHRNSDAPTAHYEALL